MWWNISTKPSIYTIDSSCSFLKEYSPIFTQTWILKYGVNVLRHCSSHQGIGVIRKNTSKNIATAWMIAMSEGWVTICYEQSYCDIRWDEMLTQSSFRRQNPSKGEIDPCCTIPVFFHDTMLWCGRQEVEVLIMAPYSRKRTNYKSGLNLDLVWLLTLIAVARTRRSSGLVKDLC